ncbi:hypothetical protein GCM10018793_22520 [Streptomyces sulfonofaciens]|uniref:Type II toxin-antitoxin system PemK/MazF family toxin n=1 Tax=Streptomyces sulfonofaciens TaxID=68272 RepID=A0A919KXR9_9ACTN|nr:hypothetical protein [Streptomyces sulfonofaciens]GHH76558.1 hypothetical protein GCM10018793_22520 [Streptomyces sulfonofaciens]
MNASWWLALAGVVVLALVAAVVDGWGRGGRRPPRGTDAERHGTPDRQDRDDPPP